MASFKQQIQKFFFVLLTQCSDPGRRNVKNMDDENYKKQRNKKTKKTEIKNYFDDGK